MSADWLILHGGALGDLVLTVQLALRLPQVGRDGRLNIVSRSHPGDLAACRPRIERRSADGLGLHWLYADHAGPPPDGLRNALCGARVLSALGAAESVVHRRLAALEPKCVYSFDPRPRDEHVGHITQQWQTDLEAQGLLVPKCIHQRPNQRTLGVPDVLRRRGKEVLRGVGSDADCVLIHPGSGGREKCWPLARFVTVARELTRRDARVCFLIGPVEIEWWAEADLAVLAREFPVLRLPAPDALAAALTAVKVLIANDSGPAHLAALLGAPTLTLFGPTDAARWRPLGRDARVFSGDPRAFADHWGICTDDVVSAALADG